jgi:hypothetical protein
MESQFKVGQFKDVLSSLLQKRTALNGEIESLKASDPYGAELKQEDLNALDQDIVSVDAAIGQEKGKALKSIETGEYKFVGPTEGVPPMPGEIREPGFKAPTNTEKLKSTLASALDVSQDVIDLDSGLPSRDRFNMSFLQDKSKEDYLVGKYKDSVQTVNVEGSPMFLVKRPDGKLVAADERGFNPKDLLDIGGEVLPALAGITGTIAAAPTQSPFLAAGAGSATSLAAGTAQDQFVRAVLGVGEKLPESILRRTTEEAVGLGIEGALGLAAKPFVKRIGKPVENKYYKSLLDAEEQFNKSQFMMDRGDKVFVPTAAARGEAKLVEQLQIGEKIPRSLLGRRISKTRSVLQEWMDSRTRPAEAKERLYKAAQDNLSQSNQELVDVVSAYDKDIAKQLRGDLDEQLYDLQSRMGKDTSVQLGDDLTNILSRAEQKTDEVKNDIYANFYDAADQTGTFHDPADVAGIIRGSLKKSYPLRNSGLEQLADQIESRATNGEKADLLRQKVAEGKVGEDKLESALKEISQLELNSGPIDPLSLDKYLRLVRDAVPEGGAVGQATPKQVASQAETALQKYRDESYAQAGLKGLWDEATVKYKERLGFETGSVGQILKEAFGEQKMTPSQVASRAISDPTIARKIIQAASVEDPAQAAVLRNRMANYYLEKVGFNGRNGIEVGGPVKFDEEMVTELFGYSPNTGERNEHYGISMVKKLNALNQSLQRNGADASKLSMRDLEPLRATMSEKSYNEAADLIAKRAKAKGDLDAFTNNKIIDVVLKGHNGVLENARLPEAMFTAPNAHVSQIMGKLNDTEKKEIRNDFVSYLFARYQPKGDITKYGNDLWDANKFLGEVTKGKDKATIERNIRTVLGDDFYDEFKNASMVATSVREVGPMGDQITPRMVASGSGVHGYVAGKITDPVKHKVASWMYAGGQLMPFIRKAYRKEISPEDYARNLTAAITASSATSRGIGALFGTGRNDPAFMDYIVENLGVLPQDDEDFREKYGTKRESISGKDYEIKK